MEKDQTTLVLVADDEPSTLALVASHVRSKGFQVIEASDGDQAWQLAYENLPDLIILDVMMPGMSGWEVCRKVREAVSLAHTGVIMLTGIGENLNEMTSPLYGADTYIDKPFQFYDLDAKIDETLKKRRESDSRDADDDDVGDDAGDDDDVGHDDAPPDSGTVPSNSGWAQRNGAGSAEPEGKATSKAPTNPGPRKAAAPKVATKKAKSKTAKKKTASKKKAKTAKKKTASKKKAKTGKKKTASKKKAKAKKAAKPARRKAKAKKAARSKAPKSKKKPARKK
jgi:CheY-like chemotaxis protein